LRPDVANAVLGAALLAAKPKQRITTMAMTSADGLGGGVRVNPVTMQPVDGRTRIRSVRIREALAPAARGP
jgi:hypothetical protein